MLSRMLLLIGMVMKAAVLSVLLGSSPSSAQTLVPDFVPVNITLTNDTWTGRVQEIALTSPMEVFELALIMDGFFVDTKYQYCWTEVHDVATGTNLTWRAPCNPLKVQMCKLVLTPDGDFRLEVAAAGSPLTTAFLSDTGGEGVTAVHLTDDGKLLLVTAENVTVWESSENIQRKLNCKEAFNPNNASRPTLAWLSLVFSILLSAIVALSS